MARTTKKSKNNRLSKPSFLKQLWFQILIGLFFGFAVGIVLSPSFSGLLLPAQASQIGSWLSLPGVIFLGLLQLVVVPLIVCSIVTGVADSGSLQFIKKIGLRAVFYFFLTSILSVTIGLLIATWLAPGSAIHPDTMAMAVSSNSSENVTGIAKTALLTDLSIPQRIANMMPTNFAQSSLEKNMLQIVIASVLVALAILSIPKASAAPFLKLCQSGQAIAMKLIDWAMLIAPYAVFGLITNSVITLGVEAITSLGLYMVTVLLGLAVMLCFYFTVARMLGGIKPIDFLKGIKEAQIIAFSTSSSAATMPISIRCGEENLKFRPEITRFTIPLGATINMDGTALYQAVAAVFLTQIFNVDLSFSEMVLLMITTVGASIGTPAIPGVGIVVLATILVGIGVPPEGIALILGVDRLLDMCRTTINVTGDLAATAVMNKWVKRV